jgi:plasmid stabilization system protein ParE
VVRPFDVHQVFYLPSDSRVEVVRVLHGARDVPELLR